MIGKFPEVSELQLLISQSQPVHLQLIAGSPRTLVKALSKVEYLPAASDAGKGLRKKRKCVESAEVSPPQCNLSEEC